MNPDATLVVVKRDGTSEPFSLHKLRRCLTVGLAGSSHDGRIADALSRAVSVHLRQLTEHRRPTTDYIFGCVRTVLNRTRLSDIGDRLAQHRRMRAAARRRLRVSDALDSAGRTTRWQKRMIVAVLQNAHGLQRNTARILAGEIESRILSMNYAVVSQVLIAELIRNELLVWGLADDALVAPRPAVSPSAVQQPRKKE
ncbi:MAG: hypothetical protein U1D55_04065 [Phycisphaerae bacterium]